MSKRSVTVMMTRKQIPKFLLAILIVLFSGSLKIELEDNGTLNR